MFGEKLELQVGDEVLVTSLYRHSIKKVKRITPTGNIRLEDDSYYDAYGYVKSSDSWDNGRLYLLTPEKKKAFVENAYIAKTISELKKIEKLSYEQAVKIMEIIDVN